MCRSAIAFFSGVHKLDLQKVVPKGGGGVISWVLHGTLSPVRRLQYELGKVFQLPRGSKRAALAELPLLHGKAGGCWMRHSKRCTTESDRRKEGLIGDGGRSGNKIPK